MAKRSKVELYEQIRKAHERDELSIRALAEHFGVHRRTVREALASPVPPPRRRPAPGSGAGPWKATIDGWLAEDRDAPRRSSATPPGASGSAWSMNTAPRWPSRPCATTWPWPRRRRADRRRPR